MDTLIHCELARLGQQHSQDNKKKLSQLWVDAVHLRENEGRKENDREARG